jgi:hypothetical protein
VELLLEAGAEVNAQGALFDRVASHLMFVTTNSQSDVQNIVLNVFFCMASFHLYPNKWSKDRRTLLEEDDASSPSPAPSAASSSGTGTEDAKIFEHN